MSTGKAAELPSTSFQKLSVSSTDTIRKFVIAKGLTYKAGCSFYQLTKPELISAKKHLIVEDKSSGRMIIGDAVKKILKLDGAVGRVTVDASEHEGFNIYVRSDSYNRKLVPGTILVYVTELPETMQDVDDIDEDGEHSTYFDSMSDAPDTYHGTLKDTAAPSSTTGTATNPLVYMGAPAQYVQMAISFDTTGSMYTYLDEVKRFAKETIHKVLSLGSEKVEMCIIAHGDYCDENSTYLMINSGFSSDVATLVKFIDGVGRTGGGDLPEAYEYVLAKTLEFDWKPEAQKSLLMIGDAMPHEDHQARYDWKEEIVKYTERGIKIYALQCGGIAGASAFYQKIADETFGVHLDMKKVAEVTDFVVAIAYAEGNPKMIIDYHESLKKKNHGTLSASLENLFSKISART
ncbi:hypothetical protein HK097_003105, partial [Rhizophlyctis rosea]